MASFTFSGLFTTTSKGIPDTTQLPASIKMNHSYYLYSLLLQATLLLFFLLYFILSIFRVLKKIKNKSFREVPQDDENEEKEPTAPQLEAQNEQQADPKDENLIYHFDDDQEEVEKEDHEGEIEDKDQDELKQQEEKNEIVEEDYNDYHDASEESFIRLDDKLLFLQPFLISFIIANNLFQANLIVLSCLVLMLLTYYFINVKEHLQHLRLAPMLFMLFPLAAYISFFAGDHDLTT